MLTKDRHNQETTSRALPPQPVTQETADGVHIQHNPERQRWVKIAVAALLAAGVVLTLYLGSTASSAEEVGRQLSLERQADAVSASVESRIDQYVEVLFGLEGLAGSNPSLSRAEFASYLGSAEVTERLPGFQALEWAPVVLHEDLLEYEESVRTDTSLTPEGYPDFAVHPASDNADHIVVDYVVPIAGNEKAFGFDLGTNPARRAAIELAASTRLPVATAPITLVQETGEQQGFLIFVPVFRDDQLAGLVLAVFRVGDLLDGTVADQPVDLITDVTDEDGGPLFGVDPTDPDGVATRYITVGTRQWEITVASRSDERSLLSTALVLRIAGLVTTLAIVALVIVVSRARDRAERRAMRATRDLSFANATLTRSNEDLAEFASVASHDLQTPVRNVIHATEILREDLSGKATIPRSRSTWESSKAPPGECSSS